MPNFPTGEIEQIGTPIAAAVEQAGVSRSDAAGIIVKTLVSLQIYPHSNELADVVGEQVKQFSGARESDSQAGEAGVAIRYSLDLDPEVLTTEALLERYKAAGHKAYEPWQPLWSQFSSVELNKRRIGEQVTAPAKPFQGRVVGWLQGGDHQTETGLYLVDQTWTEQQQTAQAKIDAYAATPRANTALWLPSFGDYVFAHAAEAEAYDGVVLDGPTFSRLVQHDMKPVDGGGSCGPAVRSDGGELYPGGSGGRAFPDGGVRFLMGQTNLEA